MPQRKSLISFDRKNLGQAPGLVGIDEAGRGSFAGPVVAGAVWALRSFYANATPLRRSEFINDSKQLSPSSREEIFALVEHWEKSGELLFATGAASGGEIDELNILGATKLAMQRAIAGVLKKFETRSPAGTPCPFESAGSDAPLFKKESALSPILIDGNPLTQFCWKHKAIVKGDATSLAIALASIVAKVSRDRLMCELSAQFPNYDFASNKGYGTKKHVEAILRNGITPLHRITFLRKLAAEYAGKNIPGLEKFFPKCAPAPEQSEFSF
ncbi:MAG: ribonuclease HII [Opitutae bacterium]|nr:ribonuclease HII [Opitutae bacterium]MCD8299331.1 ribonuclease HII [Opitutae bacterium]